MARDGRDPNPANPGRERYCLFATVVTVLVLSVPTLA